ncbi:hypothetical protein FHR23_000463 [Stakelama sediminis]|uniref:DUF4136 domain-containing protein n=1 Tax=Stakelama sediminis TaxID=463200 RepID=A0A840YVG2_9SPHN|nr:DUF4136 domain-containing protein [Stakelama sediminis]MBB5717556.1 hypothetical protein [Stakelama sediminis]
MRRTGIMAAAGLALLTAGCSTTPHIPVDVTRYHLDPPIARMTYTIQPLSTQPTISQEYQQYADAVATQLNALGFAPASAGNDDNDIGKSGYIAAMSYTRAPVGTVRKRPPLSIGLGGGSFGGDVGVGGGASFGIGGGVRQVIGTQLSVQLRRRSDNTVVWEGRAVTQTVIGGKDSSTAAIAQKLAAALFKGFPGESGITITVK